MDVQLFQHRLLKSLSSIELLLLSYCLQKSVGHNYFWNLYSVKLIYGMCLFLCEYHIVTWVVSPEIML